MRPPCEGGNTMRIDHRKEYTFFQEGGRLFEEAMAKGVAPRRIPVFAQLHEFAMREIGANAAEFYSSPDLLAYAQLETYEKYGIDIPTIDYDCYNIEAEAMGQKMIFNDHDMPDVDRSRPLISGPGDLARIRTPDFDNSGRCARIIEAQKIFLEKTGLQPTLGFCAPFSLAANIHGTEDLILNMFDAPDFVKELLTRVTEEIIAPWILHQRKHFPNAVTISGADAVASIPIVSPDIIREWVAPSILRLRELCGSDVYVANWVGESYLADPVEMLDLKLDVSPNFIGGQDPDVEKLGPELYVEYADKHDVPLVLGVGAGFMALSELPRVYDRVKRYIEAGKRHDRFALYLCNLGATTPPENVRAAIDAVRVHGDKPVIGEKGR